MLMYFEVTSWKERKRTDGALKVKSLQVGTRHMPSICKTVGLNI
jgi:hypothetical protein